MNECIWSWHSFTLIWTKQTTETRKMVHLPHQEPELWHVANSSSAFASACLSCKCKRYIDKELAPQNVYITYMHMIARQLQCIVEPLYCLLMPLQLHQTLCNENTILFPTLRFEVLGLKKVLQGFVRCGHGRFGKQGRRHLSLPPRQLGNFKTKSTKHCNNQVIWKQSLVRTFPKDVG